LNPNNPDSDMPGPDGLLDGDPNDPNPRLQDTDGDGLTDGQEVNGVSFTTTINGATFDYSGTGLAKSKAENPDSDFDGLSDYIEIISSKTRWDVADTDSDGLSDYEEVEGAEFHSVINGVTINTVRGDGQIVSNPLLNDTDGDGLRDYNEVRVHLTYPYTVNTDGDGVNDGSTSTTKGEIANDFDGSILGYGTLATELDSDADRLEDNFELFGVSFPTTIDGTATTINAAGYTSATTPKLGIFNTDSDNDGLSDGEEVYDHFTDPLNPDTDGDSLLDGEEITNGTDPLTPQGDIDSDGDGLLDSDEESNIPPTDPDLFDSDGDGMGDGDESLQVTIAATGYNLSTNATYAINFSAVSVNLDTTFQDNDGDGVADGYDSDGDGLSDAFEMYWYRSTSFIQGIHPQFTAFSGSSESCGYSLSGSQPLHPDDPDTDDDGLLDGAECNVYNTNPFSAANEGPLFDKVTDLSFLDLVVYPALEGNLGGAAAGANDYDAPVSSSDGMITVRIIRAIDPTSSGGNKRYLVSSLITGLCGDTAYADSVGIVTTFTNECGVMVGTEPNISNDDTAANKAVLVRIPMSEFFSLLSSSKIDQVIPVTN